MVIQLTSVVILICLGLASAQESKCQLRSTANKELGQLTFTPEGSDIKLNVSLSDELTHGTYELHIFGRNAVVDHCSNNLAPVDRYTIVFTKHKGRNFRPRKRLTFTKEIVAQHDMRSVGLGRKISLIKLSSDDQTASTIACCVVDGPPEPTEATTKPDVEIVDVPL